jgi:hypothetical protein
MRMIRFNEHARYHYVDIRNPARDIPNPDTLGYYVCDSFFKSPRADIIAEFQDRPDVQEWTRSVLEYCIQYDDTVKIDEKILQSFNDAFKNVLARLLTKNEYDKMTKQALNPFRYTVVLWKQYIAHRWRKTYLSDERKKTLHATTIRLYTEDTNNQGCIRMLFLLMMDIYTCLRMTASFDPITDRKTAIEKRTCTSAGIQKQIVYYAGDLHRTNVAAMIRSLRHDGQKAIDEHFGDSPRRTTGLGLLFQYLFGTMPNNKQMYYCSPEYIIGTTLSSHQRPAPQPQPPAPQPQPPTPSPRIPTSQPQPPTSDPPLPPPLKYSRPPVREGVV